MNTFAFLFKKVIATKINLNDYDGTKIGQYIGTSLGDFIVISKPNIYQPGDDRFWEFQFTADTDGEPIMDGIIIKIKSV